MDPVTFEDEWTCRIECPRCGAEQMDYDGLGVSYCDECGYCAHISGTGNLDGEIRCDTCGETISGE